MTLMQIIAALYASEINCGVQTFWDGGVSVWIGDESNGLAAETAFDDPWDESRVVAWLDRAARERYTASAYARGESPRRT